MKEHALEMADYEKKLARDSQKQKDKLAKQLLDRRHRRSQSAAAALASGAPSSCEIVTVDDVEGAYGEWKEQALQIKRAEFEQVRAAQTDEMVAQSLMQQHAIALKQYEQKLALDADQQKGKLAARLAERRRLRLAQAAAKSERETPVTEAELEERFADWKQQAVANKQEELDAIRARSDSATAQKLMQEHAIAIKKYEQKLESDKELQKEKLAARLRARQEQRARKAKEASRTGTAAAAAVEDGVVLDQEVESKYEEWKDSSLAIKRQQLAEERANCSDEDEAKKLIKEHARQLQQYELNLTRNADAQKDKLAARLAARKQRRQMKVAQSAVVSDEELEQEFESWKQEKMTKKKDSLEVEVLKLKAEHAKNLGVYKQRLASQKDDQHAKLAARLAERKRARKELKVEEPALEQEYHQWHEQAIQAKQQELEADLAGADADTASQLIKEHARALKAYKSKLASDKDRQKDKLAERLAARKRKREMANRTTVEDVFSTEDGAARNLASSQEDELAIGQLARYKAP